MGLTSEAHLHTMTSMVNDDQPDEPLRDQLTHDVGLHADIDARLADVWVAFWQTSHWEPEPISAFMRWSYGQGYTDSLIEQVRGELLRNHGLPVPKRQSRDDVDSR